MNCKDCSHYEVCEHAKEYPIEGCDYFINKADVVKVVRCKDCKYYKRFNGCGNWCHKRIRSDIEYHTKPNDFCSYGKRKGT